MDDAHLVLNHLPVCSTFGCDREIAIASVRKPNDLLTEIKIKEPLLAFAVFVVVPVDLRERKPWNPA